MALRDVSEPRYTPGQAAAKKALIDVDLAAIQDTALHMKHVVGDHDVRVSDALASLEEVAFQLKAIVDRRTQP